VILLADGRILCFRDSVGLKWALVNSQSVVILVLAILCVAAHAQSPAGASKSAEQVRRIILRTQHLVAHGMGYDDLSLKTLSHKITPLDVPALISLVVSTANCESLPISRLLDCLVANLLWK
jgi:hypothetical protein